MIRDNICLLLFFTGVEKKSAVSSLVSLFYHQEELARTEERKTDAILDGEPKPKTQANVNPKSQEEVIEETVAMCKLLLCWILLCVCVGASYNKYAIIGSDDMLFMYVRWPQKN